METADQTIARLREEKKIFLAALLKVEDWAFGEGYFLTPSMDACFKVVRKLGENPDDAAEKPPLMFWKQMQQSHEPRVKRPYNITPEKAEARRQAMREYWRKKKAALSQ